MILVDLRLTGLQQHQQPGVVEIVCVVDDGVDQIGRRHRAAVRKRAAIQRDRVGTVLQRVVGKRDVRARNA